MSVGTAYGLADPMGSLFEKYDVPYGDYERLAWELAGKYEIGFKPSKAGRPREVPAWLFEEYIVAFSKYSKRRSLRKLAKRMHQEFPDVTPPWETLRKHFAQARDVANQRRRARLAQALAGG
jgi:hypothetical protein